jgi:hypothetical protein
MSLIVRSHSDDWCWVTAILRRFLRESVSFMDAVTVIIDGRNTRRAYEQVLVPTSSKNKCICMPNTLFSKSRKSCTGHGAVEASRTHHCCQQPKQRSYNQVTVCWKSSPVNRFAFVKGQSVEDIRVENVCSDQGRSCEYQSCRANDGTVAPLCLRFSNSGVA